jgi:hypothetical protein
MKRFVTFLFVFSLLFGPFLTGCGGGRTAVSHNHPMAPLEEMPDFVRKTVRKTQEAYQFSVANPEIADAIPCYCGCFSLGHTSSYDCYVAGKDESGALLFDDHAQYCSICVDITQDTMQLLDEGKSTAEIFTQIEADYARFSPPTVKPEAGES